MHSARTARLAAVLLSFGLTLFNSAAHAEGAVFNDSGVAIRGYDPVAYFSGQDAVKGDAGIAHNWNGATWHFASTQNRQRFIEDPQRFAPQYGGYCAYAAANNAIAPTDPLAWSVHQGKLYLNFSSNVRRRWREDIPGNVSRADGHWPGLLHKL